jgi:hypothetical protein
VQQQEVSNGKYREGKGPRHRAETQGKKTGNWKGGSRVEREGRKKGRERREEVG